MELEVLKLTLQAEAVEKKGRLEAELLENKEIQVIEERKELREQAALEKKERQEAEEKKEKQESFER